MIPGLSGDLVTHSFVEEVLLPQRPRDDRLSAFERAFAGWWKRVSRVLGPASSARAVHDVAVSPLVQLLGHERPTVAPHSAGYCGVMESSRIVCLSTPWAIPVRTSWRAAAATGSALRAPWAIVCNGRALRIADCTRIWARNGIEFDLPAVATSPKAIAALWQLAGSRALSSSDALSLRSIVAGSEAHAVAVCASLGTGVLDVLPRLASAFAQGKAPPALTLDHGLTVIYRVLFLLFAEARGLVPIWHGLYRDAYSLEVLTQQAARGQVRGLWAALRAISRLAHAGCKAGDLEVTAFNGRLFSPRHAPLIEQRRVPDAVAAEVLLGLATQPTASGRRRISYHDLGVEQLGSVYERLLEYEPVAAGGAVRLSRTSTERKATGSFYTPRSITEFLVRRTLSPLTDGRRADEILRLRVLDPAMGSGAFLVAACRYLAEQCEHAYLRDGEWFPGEIHHDQRALLRRRVAEQCIFGVDLNPTAVQLARLSLWLTTMAADRPLTFLDHHLAAGNSLLGARLSDLSRPPRSGRPHRDTPLPLLDDQLAGLMAHDVLPARLRIAATSSDSAAIVRAKEGWLADLAAPDGAVARWSAAADAWCAAALSAAPRPSPGLVAEWIAAATGARTTLPHAQLHASLRDARLRAAQHGAFHWELAFPEVFFDDRGRLRSDGGFDAVIGNPPWDMMRADTGNAAERATARATTSAALRFFRDSGTFTLQGRGHANRYQLFLERALQLTRRGGRVGLILPSGIATDHGSAVLRRHLFERTSIDTWLGFDNRRRIFPIHRSTRFVLMSTANAGSTPALPFQCGLIDPRLLEAEATAAPLVVSRSRLESWSPDLAIPEVPDVTALAIVSGVSGRIPPLGGAAGWNVRFGRELNATDDRPHFVPLTKSRRALLPVVEGKLLSPFQIDLGRAACGIPARAAKRLLNGEPFERSRIAYRDVASATNKLTLIAAILPPRTISTHTVFVARTLLEQDAQWCLLALLNSLVANYLVRLRVTTHVTTATMAHLPVPKPATGSPAFARLAALARALSVKGIDDGAQEYAELNALAAQLYGLNANQFDYVLKTFPLIPAAVRDQAFETFAALTDGPVLPRLQ